MVEEYERRLGRESGFSSAVNQRVADLKRSIESNPNRNENYLELARAYEKAGEPEKAAEVYRRARERFPEDERVRQESEAFRSKPPRSTQRENRKEADSSKEDSR